MDSTLAVLSTVRCLAFLKRGMPSAAKPLGTVDEDREAGERFCLASKSYKICLALLPRVQRSRSIAVKATGPVHNTLRPLWSCTCCYR